MTQHCGVVAVIGAPNAGKSTLVNALVGQKVAITSAKAQTTRARLLGIALEGETQIILADTPGIFEPRRRLDRAMVSAAWEGTQAADAVLLVVDPIKQRRHELGYGQQRVHLFSASIRDNLSFGMEPKPSQAAIEEATRAAQIVTNANGHLGRLVESRMGVIQINPKGSSATSAARFESSLSNGPMTPIAPFSKVRSSTAFPARLTSPCESFTTSSTCEPSSANFTPRSTASPNG